MVLHNTIFGMFCKFFTLLFLPLLSQSDTWTVHIILVQGQVLIGINWINLFKMSCASDLNEVSYLMKESLTVFSCSQSYIRSCCQQVGDRGQEGGSKCINTEVMDSAKASCYETDYIGWDQWKDFNRLCKGQWNEVRQKQSVEFTQTSVIS